jgi:hypothetical protein
MLRGYLEVRQMNLLGRGESCMRRNSIRVFHTLFLVSQAQSKLNEAYKMGVVNNKCKCAFIL